MALTQAQKDAIQRQLKKNIAKRAATQKTKISDKEARSVSSTLNKRPGVTPSYVRKDTKLISNSEAATMKKQGEINAKKEKMIQKNRNLAKRLAKVPLPKGEKGKLPLKDRVGTTAEYKKLGKEIETRRALIAYAKQARKNQAERAKNPKATPAKATPVKAAPAAQATPEKAAKPVAAKKTTAKKTTPAKKTAATPKPKTPKAPKAPKAPKMTTTPTVETPAPKTTKAKKTSKPKSTPKKMLGPAKPVMGPLVDQPRFFPGPQKSQPKLQTLEEAKAKAPTPKPATAAPKASETPSKAPNKVTSKVADAKKAVKSSTAGRAVKAAAKTPVAQAVAKSKTAKVLKVGGKLGGKVLKVGAAIGAVKEVGQIVSGQAEKDFRRIQALENRIAVAKGQKPKYTRTGSNPNLIESLKVDAGNALSWIGAGKSRKDRLEELKQMAKKAEAKKAPVKTPKQKPAGKTPVVTTPGGQKVGGTSKAPSGNKYRVTSGDTLSGIAQRAGVSLKELRAANPQITDPRKIYRNTGVVIPKSGKVPTGGYSKKAK